MECGVSQRTEGKNDFYNLESNIGVHRILDTPFSIFATGANKINWRFAVFFQCSSLDLDGSPQRQVISSLQIC